MGRERRRFHGYAQASAIASGRETSDSPENLPECTLIVVADHPSDFGDRLR